MRFFAVLVLAGVCVAQADEAGEAEQPVSFHRDVRPILQASCQGCHQPAKDEGEIVLVTHADLMRNLGDMGGDDDLIVAPGAPEKSLLLDVITPFEDEPPLMPVDAEQLTADEVDLIRRWIAEGARDDTPEGATRNPGGVPIYARPPVVTSLDFSPVSLPGSSPGGVLLAVAGRGETLLHRVEAEGTELTARLVGLSERVESVAFSPDGQRLAVAGGSPGRMGELQIWRVAPPELDLSLPVSFDTIAGVSWSADGKLVAFGCKDDSVRAVDALTGEEVLFQKSHEDWVLGTAFSTDDSHLVSVGRDRSLKLVKVATQQFIDNITSITPGALRGGLMSVERHPTKDELLVGGADGVPKTYRMYREQKRKIGDDYNLLQAFEVMPGRIFSTAWSPDGTRVAAGSSLTGRGEVRVYAAEAPEPIWVRSFETGIYALAFGPDGARLATAGFDGVVRILDAKHGQVTLEFVPVPLTLESAAGVVEAAAQTAEAPESTGASGAKSGVEDL